MNIEEINYPEMVRSLAKNPFEILNTCKDNPTLLHLMHMAVGISGESGELLDAVKKHVIYNKPLDRENIIEELGDLEFFMEGLRQHVGVSREETILNNKWKLSVRYQGFKYSDQQAQERRDKTTEPTSKSQQPPPMS